MIVLQPVEAVTSLEKHIYPEFYILREVMILKRSITAVASHAGPQFVI
jgi:hypothetical protein